MNQKFKNKLIGKEFWSPIKCKCGSSTTLKFCPIPHYYPSCYPTHTFFDKNYKETSTNRYYPYLQWYCNLTKLNIAHCSPQSAGIELIAWYEGYKNQVDDAMTKMWKMLQHFSGIEGR